jgi:thymidylate synthase ThyX
MTETFSEVERALIAPYLTNLDQPVFALRNLPEEVVAVLFAYYSRSKESLRQNLRKLIVDMDLDFVPAGAAHEERDRLANAREKARAFHEKWVVGYGHASVAEHGVVHLALEDVSILASKVIEDARLGSYTEKSTRYVQFDQRRYHRPRGVMGSRHAARYVATADALFDAYLGLAGPLKERLKAIHPPAPDQRPAAYEAACRAKAFDILRYLLPSATLTNLGLTCNGRVLEHLLSRMMSDPLEEVRELGDAMKREGELVLPTLLKYAAPSTYRARTFDALDALADSHFRDLETKPASSVTLVRYDPDAELELVATILYPYVRAPLTQLREKVRGFTAEQKAQVIDEALRRRGPWDAPLRALEHISYTFDLLVDFGAYRDIQRHRMATQQAQPLTVEHGYELPEELERFDMVEPFEALMDRARECYGAMVGSLPFEASYIVPLAFRRRLLFTWNLREVFHFIELRSAPQGHRSYRRVAQEVFRAVERVHPFIARYIRVVMEDVALGRLQAEEKAEAKREAAARGES